MGKGFFGHEARLRHRTIHCIHHQQHGVAHGHYTFNFTTEVGVPRGINDVDAVVIPFDSGVFSEDGNPTLFLQIVGVHHALLGFGTRVERTGLLEQLVYQGRFTMVYVRDDGDVTQIFDHNFASGILEIARYCTRINRSTKQDHKHPPQTSIAEFLCDHIHGALKGVI